LLSFLSLIFTEISDRSNTGDLSKTFHTDVSCGLTDSSTSYTKHTVQFTVGYCFVWFATKQRQ